MLKKCFPFAALLVVAAIALAGCSGDKNADPYAQVTLHQATYGPPVISKGWKYKIVNPEIVEAQDHLCLIREGNITEFMVGRSIADKIEGLDKSNITFNCKKLYSPYVHFRAEQIISGEDTVFMSTAGSIYYPRVYAAEEFRSKDHDEVSMTRFRYNDSAGLGRMVEKQFAVETELARVEEDGEEVWMLIGDRGSLRIGDPDEATEIVLRLLYKENLPFVGGFTFTEREEWPLRRNNQVAGTITVDYVYYMNKVFGT